MVSFLLISEFSHLNFISNRFMLMYPAKRIVEIAVNIKWCVNVKSRYVILSFDLTALKRSQIFAPPNELRQISEFVYHRCDDATADPSIAGNMCVRMSSPKFELEATSSKENTAPPSYIGGQFLSESAPSSTLTTQDMTTTIPAPITACYMCMDNPAGTVLIECGHGGLCVPCASALWRHGAGTAAAPPSRRCPLCRRPFVGVMRIVSQTGEKVASHVYSFRRTILADIVSESDEPCFPLTSLPHPRPARSPTIRLPPSIPRNPFRLMGPAQVKVAVLHYTARPASKDLLWAAVTHDPERAGAAAAAGR
jgi:hypothetical protein